MNCRGIGKFAGFGGEWKGIAFAKGEVVVWWLLIWDLREDSWGNKEAYWFC